MDKQERREIDAEVRVTLQVAEAELRKIREVVEEEENEYRWGGSEDVEGGLQPGTPDFKKILTMIDASLSVLSLRKEHPLEWD